MIRSLIALLALMTGFAAKADPGGGNAPTITVAMVGGNHSRVTDYDSTYYQVYVVTSWAHATVGNKVTVSIWNDNTETWVAGTRGNGDAFYTVTSADAASGLAVFTYLVPKNSNWGDNIFWGANTTVFDALWSPSVLICTSDYAQLFLE